MRRLLFLFSAVSLVVAVVLATSSAARRSLFPDGTDADVRASSPSPVSTAVAASAEPSAPARDVTPERATVNPTTTPAPQPVANQPDARPGASGSSAMVIA